MNWAEAPERSGEVSTVWREVKGEREVGEIRKLEVAKRSEGERGGMFGGIVEKNSYSKSSGSL